MMWKLKITFQIVGNRLIYNFNMQVIVEYSKVQCAFHKTTLAEMVDNNLCNLLHKVYNDYIPIAVCENDNEADIFIAEFLKVIDKPQTT